MKVTVRWGAVLAALALLAQPGPAEARRAGGRSFEGRGWNQGGSPASVPLAISFPGVSRGAISFDLQRTGEIPFGRPETLFELVDGRGRRVLRVMLCWASPVAPGNGALLFKGGGGERDFYLHGMGLWAPVVELDRPVAPGAWVHVDLTWDDASGESEVFLDGRRLATSHGGYDPASGSWYPDRRGEIDEQWPRGEASPFEPRPLAYFLGRVEAVHLGNYDEARHPPGRQRSLLRGAQLERFVVTVDEVPPPASGPGGAEPPEIAAVEHDARRVAGFSGGLVAGDTLEVTLEGTPGASGTFDVAHLPDLEGRVVLDWSGWGVPLEEKTFLDEGEIDLREVTGYRVFAGPEPFDPAAPGMDPVAELGATEQTHALELLPVDVPCYAGVVAVMRDGRTRAVIAPVAGRPLAETSPGEYAGNWTVGWQDRYQRAVVVGHLARGRVETTLAGDAGAAFAADPALSISVETDPSVLRADERSAAEVTVTVKDANGKAVSGHRVGFLLATTSEYTGVVGGGAFAEEVGGELREVAFGETDLFGRITATYVAGFAAKTGIIVARDMVSNDTGAGFVRTYITASADIQLEALERSLAAEGYEIRVSSSDDWLTADGRSQARITALVTLRGDPVEGHRVSFSVSPGMGSIRVMRGETDSGGEARAVYTAGRKIGVAVVTATDYDVGITGSVAIELRSDAPAKIAVRVDPDRLPADGRSRSEILVLVTDINDNPNEGVEVEYAIVAGDGSLRRDATETDRRGETSNEYTAGRLPGRVTVELTVRSAEPDEEDLLAARHLATAVPDYRFR